MDRTADSSNPPARTQPGDQEVSSADEKAKLLASADEDEVLAMQAVDRDLPLTQQTPLPSEDAFEQFKYDVIHHPKFDQYRSGTRMRVFLVSYARMSYIIKACRAAGVTFHALASWRKDHADWWPEWETYARQVFVEALEQEVDRRAFVGNLEPVYGKTGLQGYVRKFSDQLAMFRLKALDPDKYADRKKTELSGPGQGPIQMQPVVAQLEEKVEAIIARQSSKGPEGQ